MATTNTNDISYTNIAHIYAQATVTGTASTLSTLGVTIPSWAIMAYITPETGAVRYRCDGTNPTAAIGQPIANGQTWPVVGQLSLQALKLIAAANTTISIEFRG